MMPTYIIYKYAAIGLGITLVAVLVAVSMEPRPSADDDNNDDDDGSLRMVTIPLLYLQSLLKMNETERLLMVTPVPAYEQRRMDEMAADCRALFVEGMAVGSPESLAYRECVDYHSYVQTELKIRNLQMILLDGERFIESATPYNYTDYQIDGMNQMYRDCLGMRTEYQWALTDDVVAACLEELFIFMTEGQPVQRDVSEQAGLGATGHMGVQANLDLLESGGCIICR